MNDKIQEALKITAHTIGIEEKNIKIKEVFFSKEFIRRIRFLIKGNERTFNIILDTITFHFMHDVCLTNIKGML